MHAAILTRSSVIRAICRFDSWSGQPRVYHHGILYVAGWINTGTVDRRRLDPRQQIVWLSCCGIFGIPAAFIGHKRAIKGLCPCARL